MEDGDHWPMKEWSLTPSEMTPRRMSPVPPQQSSELLRNDSQVSAHAPTLMKREVIIPGATHRYSRSVQVTACQATWGMTCCLVSGDEAAVFGNVGRDDRGEARCGHCSGTPALRRPSKMGSS